MDYKIISKKMPGRPNEPEKYYASIVRPKKITLSALAKRISEISPVNELDTESVLIALTKVAPEYLIEGATIDMGDFGSFMVNISSEGADKPEEFNKNLIKGNKISYRPSVKIKNDMKNVKYNKVD